MFKQKCEFCHVMSYPGNAPPDVAPTAIPVRWLPHSTFDHHVHRPLACAECHDTATASTQTKDVLLPSVAVCRQCHRGPEGARAGCVACHLYHDNTKERDVNGPLTVGRLVGRGEPRRR